MNRAAQFAFVLTLMHMAATIVQADILATHSLVSAKIQNVGNSPSATIETAGPADTFPVHANATPPVENFADARAISKLNSSDLLFTQADAYSNVNSEPGAVARAAWRDVAIAAELSSPSIIKLWFEVRAEFGGFGYSPKETLSINTSVDVANGFTDTWDQLASVEYLTAGTFDGGRLARAESFQIIGFNTWTLVDRKFVGQFHIDVPFDDILGGYGWGIAATLGANGGKYSYDDGPAWVTGLSHVALRSVTDAAGNPIAVTFDSALSPPAIPGDYNHNGEVDAPDYVVYRRTFGQSGSGLDADGNANGEIDAGDLMVWRSNFGNRVGAATGLMMKSVPEASTILLGIVAFAVLPTSRRKSVRHSRV